MTVRKPSAAGKGSGRRIEDSRLISDNLDKIEKNRACPDTSQEYVCPNCNCWKWRRNKK